MSPVLRLVVGDHERVIFSRYGRFRGIAGPGIYWRFGFGHSAEKLPAEGLPYRGAWSDLLLNGQSPEALAFFHRVETKADEVAFVYENERLIAVEAPSTRTLYWKTLANFRVELFRVAERPLAPSAKVAELGRLGRAAGAQYFQVPDGSVGLLLVEGKYRETLPPGQYASFPHWGSVSVELVDLRVQSLEVTGQEILTSDKVSLRVNIWVEYQITDPLLARQSVVRPADHLYKVVQMAVRQSLAKRTLDAVLEARTDLDEAVAAEVRAAGAQFGYRVGAMAIKDIIPPGEVRAMLEQVVAAERKAQANLIHRREETAATRSLLNTARLMAEHPLLVRMKELEALEKIAGKVEKIHLYGGFDAVLRGLVPMGQAGETE